jgi:hypothetical protein
LFWNIRDFPYLLFNSLNCSQVDKFNYFIVWVKLTQQSRKWTRY